MGKTSIEWTDHSVNPIRARLNGRVGHYCEKVSPGCGHCYSSTMQRRFGMPPFDEQRWTSRTKPSLFLDESKLEDVLRRRKPTRYFWCDMTDLFGEWVPDEWIDQCFATMALTPQHTHQVLTKRAERMRGYTKDAKRRIRDLVCDSPGAMKRGDQMRDFEARWPLPNVWLGVSVENQALADERIPLLLQTPAAVRFLSCEPLLGAIDLTPKIVTKSEEWEDWPPALNGVDWVIVGGESGPKSRPCDVAWVRAIRDQCKTAGVACFVKQLGQHIRDRNDAGVEGDTPTSWPMDTHTKSLSPTDWQGDPVRVKLHSQKGGNPSEWPEDLRVREFPTC